MISASLFFLTHVFSSFSSNYQACSAGTIEFHFHWIKILINIFLQAASYSTIPSNKGSPNLSPWLTLVGSGGVALAAYLLIKDQKPKQLKSPLDPEKFTDFKLQRVEPYNHNTST